MGGALHPGGGICIGGGLYPEGSASGGCIQVGSASGGLGRSPPPHRILRDTVNAFLFDVVCKQHHRTALNLFLNDKKPEMLTAKEA